MFLTSGSLNLRFFKCFSIFLVFSICSCEKEEGEGGNFRIRGKVYVKDYDKNFSVLEKKYYGHDEDVYIIYGNNVTYGDRLKTNYDGVYEFKYLREGKYKIYAYSRDSTNKSSTVTVPVISEIEIKGKNLIIEVPDIIIFK